MAVVNCSGQSDYRNMLPVNVTAAVLSHSSVRTSRFCDSEPLLDQLSLKQSSRKSINQATNAASNILALLVLSCIFPVESGELFCSLCWFRPCHDAHSVERGPEVDVSIKTVDV